MLNQDYERGGIQKTEYCQEEVVYNNCPLCHCDNFQQIFKERGVLGIVRCRNCSLIYVNPRLKSPEQIYWGEKEKYYSEAKLVLEGKARHHRDVNYISDLRLIVKFKPRGNLLDVGTNMGTFLRMARNMGWNLYGVEPSAPLSEMARKFFGLNVKTAYLEEAKFECKFFDVVTMVDVFEHIAQPGKILSEINRILKDDGILFIKVPNGLFNLFKFNLANLSGRLKQHDIFDSYEHVVHYTQATLQAMLRKFGFKAIKIFIGKPIQLPAWHKYVGFYYSYPTPWVLDPLTQSLRSIFYLLSNIEFRLRFNRIGYLAPNIIAIAKKV